MGGVAAESLAVSAPALGRGLGYDRGMASAGTSLGFGDGHRWRCAGRAGTTGLLAGCAILMSACLRDTSNLVGFDEPDPQARIRAAMRADETDDRSAAPRLVEMLDSDDPAERIAAIEALRDFTGGETFGYRHFDDRVDRRAAIDRWVEWARQQGAPASGEPNTTGTTP